PWNGFKMCRADAVPLSGESGIKEIEEIVMSEAFAAESAGTCETHDIKPAYWEKLKTFITFKGKPKIVVDYANAMGVVEIEGIKDCFEITPLFEELDGSFPNHEANPLEAENLEDVSQATKGSGAIFGAAYDGDADRCGFVDENGEIVTMDLITAMLAREVLKAGPAKILYDLRSSWAVKEYIEEYGGEAIQCRVGHAFIKNQMRECDSPFAGELAGHYYFKENFTAESSGLAMIMLANIIDETGQSLSEIAAPLKKYHSTGEINTSLTDFNAANAIMEKVKADYASGHQFELDGISTEFDDWWFNMRRSNTEPKLRLIVEAKTAELMAEKRDELMAIVHSML
ncbi:MAG: phosphomannomutase/phosphoglucomutase, partial [Lentisphaeria bacterium]|nr:phosphomannomutase/phosphoglucomutase [Lentisphaeria bacterium]NQZ70946.1 phosphomannomutase/phosphoglucomutase [Lentisphaeria bacterium]